MPNTNQDSIGKTLEKVAKNEQAGELYFHPQSGELSVSKKGETVDDPDRVPATRMAREGFFVCRSYYY